MNPSVLLRLSAALLFSSGMLRAASSPAPLELWPEGVPDLRADAGDAREENERVANVHRPTLAVFPAPADTANGTAVIVCPGGGYVRLSIVKEGTEIAEWLNSLGVTAFVLRYRMQEYGHPAPLRDVLRAIRTVRSRAGEFGVQPDRIGLIGFSAGGHLAASASTLFDAPEGRTGAALDAVSGRPDFAMLLYPVVTLKDPFAHRGSRRALLGENPAAELVEQLSLETRVTKDTPPTIIIHTQEDRTVPVENALLYYQALRTAGVAAEMHLYEKGPHGIGRRPETAAGRAWPDACATWLREHGWIGGR